ncbi:MAG: hypothetical protein ACI4GO_04325 [Hominenteromicrobium sp.]
MEPIWIALFSALALCVLVAAVKRICLRMTRSKLMQESLPFTVYATIRSADEAEYVVRSVLERVKWLDLYGMCRVVCLNPNEDPEIDTIIRKLTQKYPFAENGAFQTRKNVL